MRTPTLPLLSYLIAEQPESLLLLVNDQIPELVDAYPKLRRIYALRPEAVCSEYTTVTGGEWTKPEFWISTLPQEYPSLKGGVVVITSDVSDLPESAIDYLLKSETKTVISLSYGAWNVMSFKTHLSASMRMALRHFKVRIAETFFKLNLNIRKALLKVCATDLHNLGVNGFIKDEGNCYVAQLPQFTSLGDTYGHRRSPLWLFEESIQLLGHQKHAEIRRSGGGKFSHWENSLFFSALDNTDPNGNRRRYRVVVMSGWKKLIKPFFRPHRRLTVVEEPIVSGRSLKFSRSLGYMHEVDFHSRLSELVGSTEPRMLGRAPETLQGLAMYIGSLGSGGSERQLTYLVQQLPTKNLQLTVLTHEFDGDDAFHYLPAVIEAGAKHRFMNTPVLPLDPKALFSREGIETLWLLESAPKEFSDELWSLFTHLLELKPKVFHCWLDYPNVVGGLAAWLAGVPNIVLSMRSVNPTHFPPIYREWFLPYYRLLAQSPRVTLTVNSRAGAESYAEWIDVPVERFQIIPNGIDLHEMHEPTEAEVEEFRISHNLNSEAPVMIGVMRLSVEKRPLRFVRIVSEVQKQIPNLRAFLVGIGPQEEQVRREIKNIGLEKTLTMLGRRHDVLRIMAAGQVTVLTSVMEGFPNVLMESQWVRRPVVSTNVGGVPEVVKNGETGFLTERENVSEMATRCVELLTNTDLRRQFGAAGRAYIEENLSVEKMYERTVAAYGKTLTELHEPRPNGKVANG